MTKTRQPRPIDVFGDGRFLLYRGDCRKVLPTLAQASVDMVFTDPPFGHNNNNNGDLIHHREAALGRLPCGAPSPLGRPITNDGPEANTVFRSVLPLMWRAMKAAGCCCCCCGGGGGPDPQLARWSLWMNEVFRFKQMIVWDKGKMGMGWHYRRSTETILVGEKPGKRCKWYDRTHRVENIIRPGDYGIRKIIPNASQHPTQKPVALSTHFIRLHSRRGEVVLDPFMGSGSTAVSCLQTGRRFVGIEVNPEYVEIARRRIKAAGKSLTKNRPVRDGLK